MTMALFVVAAVLSLAASWLLVTRLERVGERLGLTEGLLGLLAALAANAPEVTSAVTALVRNQPRVGAGVILGSNVFNLAALLGLGALVAGRIRLHRRVVVLGGGVAVWTAAVCVAAVTGAVAAPVALVAALVVVVPYVVALGEGGRRLARLPLQRRLRRWLATAVTEEEAEIAAAGRPRVGDARDAVLAAVALVVVVVASVVMEHAATAAGDRHGVAQIITGALVLAVVTSLPNAVAAVYLATRGRGSAVLSTALNSNTLNVVVGLLLPATILGLGPPQASAELVAGWYLALTVVTLALAFAGRGLRRWSGAVVVAGYVGFVVAVLAEYA